jgi:thiol-disulfide isomerase/thioredoxin
LSKGHCFYVVPHVRDCVAPFSSITLCTMKKSFLLLAILLTFTSAFSQEIKKVKIDELARMIDTSSSPLIINFWASWCQPCIHEIPWFEKAVAEVKDKNVKIILVSLDFANDYKNKTLQKFVKTQGYSSKVVWLDETNANVFCPKIDSSWDGAIPVTLMVNNHKKYRQFYGTQLKEERFKLELAKLIE